MRNIHLTLEYEGTDFHGWQRQPDLRTVQGTLEQAASTVLRHPVETWGCARTDAGVHARGYVSNFHTESDYTVERMRSGLNGCLPEDVVVTAVSDVPEDFHARFSARSRHYLFRILNRRSPPALETGKVWHVSPRLDADAMHAAAQVLVGQHDFTTFRAAECQAQSPVKTLDRLDVSRRADEIHIEASARSFLHHQIRSFAGTLKLVGEGKWQPRDVKKALEAKDRAACGPVAPPDGLYLVRINY